MKFRTVFALAAAASCLISGAAIAQTVKWKSVAPPGVMGTEYLTDDIETTPGGRIYGLAWLLSVDRNSILLKSSDQGATWSVHTIVNPENDMWLYDLAFTTDETGFAVGNAGDCQCGVVMKTTNGGTSWTSTPFHGTGSISGITFLNPQTGFITGSGGLLSKTTDGGNTWKSIAMPAAPGYSLQDIKFPTATVGYIAAQGDGGSWPTKLLKTTDGGNTWAKIQDFGNAPTAEAFRELHFITQNVGVAVGRKDNQPTIFRTTDGGATWSKVYSAGPTYTSEFKALHTVDFLNDKVGMAAGDFGLILRTTDGGATWKADGSGVGQSNDFNAIKMFSEASTVVGGAHGALVQREATVVAAAVLSASELNFGTVESGSKELELTLAAGSSVDVIVDEIAIKDPSGTTSGFTLVSPTQPPPLTIAQGDAPLTIKVRFEPQNNGKTTVVSELFMRTNDPGRREIHLPLRAKQNAGQSAVTLSATELSFGEVGPDEPRKRTVTITAGSQTALQVKSIDIESLTGQEGFTATSDLKLPTLLPPGGSVTITVTFTPEDFSGETQASLLIETNDPSSPHSVFLSGTGAQPTVSASVSALDFGSVTQGDRHDLTFTLAAGNGVGLRVDNISVEDPSSGFTITAPTGSYPLEVVKDQPLTVGVRFEPGSKVGPVATRLIVRTNDPAASQTAVNLTATAVAGTSSVDDRSIDAAMTLTARPMPISSTGEVTLTVSRPGRVTVSLVDMSGAKVAVLFEGMRDAGTLTLPVDMGSLPNGAYYCVAEGAQGRVATKVVVSR